MRFLAVAFFLISFQLQAAQIWSESASTSSPAVNVFLEGKIIPGDYKKLKLLLEKQGPRVKHLYLFSPGGDLAEALQISELVKKLQLRTAGPEVGYDDAIRPFPECRTAKPRNPTNCVCASACFVIWAAGGERDQSVLAVHRPIFEKESFGALSIVEAEARYEKLLRVMGEYIDTLRVPADVKEKMLSTPTRDAYVFATPEEMTGLAPAFDEWIAARCKSLSRREESRYFGLVAIANRGRATPSEKQELETLTPKVNSILLCQALEKLQRRFQLFSDYFGVDYAAQLRAK